MNKLKNNPRLIKGILLILLASFIFITSLILFIQSIDKYDDGYGTSFSANIDYVICMFSALIFLGYSIYFIARPNGKLEFAKIITILVISLLLGLHSIGKFFKLLFKAVNKEVSFDYIGNQIFLYFGIASIIVLIIACISLHEYRKKENILKN